MNGAGWLRQAVAGKLASAGFAAAGGPGWGRGGLGLMDEIRVKLSDLRDGEAVRAEGGPLRDMHRSRRR